MRGFGDANYMSTIIFLNLKKVPKKQFKNLEKKEIKFHECPNI